jgi:malonate transporter and related proteins
VLISPAPLLDIFAPVVALIALGYAASRFGIIGPAAIKPLADLAFLLMTPALLFRAMALTPFDDIKLQAPSAYFGAAVPIFFAIVAFQLWRGRSAQYAAVDGLASTFSNTAMMGIPIISLAFGTAGLSVLLTIIAMHALILLTSATLILEMGRANRDSRLGAIGQAIRASIVHPVVLPILAGVAWSLFHVPMPKALDTTLNVLGVAAPPVCLLLLGATIAQLGLATGARQAWRYCLVKNLLQPLATYAMGRFVLGLEGLPLIVATIAAAMPIGNNVFLFAQRYEVAQAQVSAGVVLSTLISAPITMLILHLLA